MTQENFKKWFHEYVIGIRKWFQYQNLSQITSLVLDNALGHLSEEELQTEDKRIIALFLSLNCSVLIQPVDEYII